MVNDNDFEYSLTEFCRITRLDADHVREMVEVGIIEPHIERDYWYFSRTAVSRCMKVERLRQDLEVNLNGAVLALELMERNRRLRQKIAYLEQLIDRLSG